MRRDGQHLTLRTEIKGEDVRRSYSICSAVQDKSLRIVIKRVAGGMFSNWANDMLKPGVNRPINARNERHCRHPPTLRDASGREGFLPPWLDD